MSAVRPWAAEHLIAPRRGWRARAARARYPRVALVLEALTRQHPTPLVTPDAALLRQLRRSTADRAGPPVGRSGGVGHAR
ncbi:MAG TPA: hypothetical protein VHE83_16345 [Mycobacteriales bacterium]|nr:hypothetical protein [Mycobacteriales bacterium]